MNKTILSVFLSFSFQLKVGFLLSDELVRKVNDFAAAQQEMDDGTQLVTSADGDRKLVFKQDLKVEFSNNTTQARGNLISYVRL